MPEIVAIWRESLHTILDRYERKKISTWLFFPLLFLFFIFLNIACYWWAIYTAFPHYMQTHEASHYVKLQIPVGFFGALFDSLSFFITIWIIKRALAASKTSEYVFHLSLDLIIAIVATFWVLFVFTFGRLADQSMGKCSRTTDYPRSQVHQSGRTSDSRSNRTRKCKKHILRADYGNIRRTSHLLSPSSLLLFHIQKSQESRSPSKVRRLLS